MSEKDSFEAATHKQQAAMFVAPPPPKPADSGLSPANYYQKAKLILPTAVWILIIVGGLCFLSVLSSLNKTINTLDNLIEIEQAEMKDCDKHDANNHDPQPASKAKLESPLVTSGPTFDPLSKPSGWLDLPPWASLDPRPPSLGPQSILDQIFHGLSSRSEPVSGGVIVASSSGSANSKGIESLISDLLSTLALGAAPEVEGSKLADGKSYEQPMLTANIDTININIGEKPQKAKIRKHQPANPLNDLSSFLMKGLPMDDSFKPDFFSIDPMLGQPGKPSIVRKVVSKTFGPFRLDPLQSLPEIMADPFETKQTGMPEVVIAVDPIKSQNEHGKFDKQVDKNPLDLSVFGLSSQPPKKKINDSLDDIFNDPFFEDSKSTSTKPVNDSKEPSKSLLDMLFGPPLEPAPTVIVHKLPPYAHFDSKQDSDKSKNVNHLANEPSPVLSSEVEKSIGSSQATTAKEERLNDDIFGNFLAMAPWNSMDSMNTEAQSKGNQGAVKVPAQGKASTTTAKPKAGAAAKSTVAPASAKGGSTTPAAKAASTPASDGANKSGASSTPASSASTPASSGAAKTATTTPKGEARKSRSAPEGEEGNAVAFDDDKPPVNPWGRPGSLLFAFNNSTNNFVPRLLNRLNLSRFSCGICQSFSKPTERANSEPAQPPPDSPPATENSEPTGRLPEKPETPQPASPEQTPGSKAPQPDPSPASTLSEPSPDSSSGEAEKLAEGQTIASE